DDPVMEARRQFIKELGRSSFIEVDVDYAATMLAQGTGRLIRSVEDVGGVLLLDRRAMFARYSSKVTNLLPSDWPLTSDIDAFVDWMEWVNPDTRDGDIPAPSPKSWS